MLRARDLTWQVAGRRIVDRLSFDVRQGERVALVGPNGAGKSTTLQLLAGLLAPTEGELHWRGGDLLTLSPKEKARRVAYVPQTATSDQPWSVEEFVLMGRYPLWPPWRGPRAEDRVAVARALAAAELEGLAARAMASLSGGERQRAYLAGALAQGGDLLLLDEPTAHLDPPHQLQLAKLLQDILEETGRALLFATHDLDFAAHVSSRVIALQEGRLVADESVEEFFRPPRLAAVFGAPFRVLGPDGSPAVALDWTPS